ncbi:MAG: N-acetylglucosamine kinase, partial [Pseudomonadota bacterium]|nr:N-acetylglucosamine kinase [Pseudomonadota bacterium]MEE3091753.1 N-acetylglucosamine kinase [Pseudomonadota bacterium]
MSEPLIVTVDGGGTQCRAAIFEADGRRLGRAAGAFANLVTDFEDSRRHITETIDAAYRDAGMADMSERSDIAVLGIAGAEIGDLSTRLEGALD